MGPEASPRIRFKLPFNPAKHRFALRFVLALLAILPMLWYLKGVLPTLLALTYATALTPKAERESRAFLVLLSHVSVFLALGPIVGAVMFFAAGVRHNFFMAWTIYLLAVGAVVDFVSYAMGWNIIDACLRIMVWLFWLVIAVMNILLIKVCWAASPLLTATSLLVFILIWALIRGRFRVNPLVLFALLPMLLAQVFMLSTSFDNELNVEAIRNDPAVSPIIVFQRDHLHAGPDTARVIGSTDRVRKIALDAEERHLFVSFSSKPQDLEDGSYTVIGIDLEGEPGVLGEPPYGLRYGHGRDLVFDPNTGYLYATIYMTREVVALSTPDLEIVHAIQTRYAGPHNLALNTELNHLYVGHENGMISVVSTAEPRQFEVIYSINNKGSIQEMALDQRMNTVYMASMTAYQLMTASSSTRRSERRVFVPLTVRGVAFDKVNSRAYASHFVLGLVSEWKPGLTQRTRLFRVGTGARIIEVDPDRGLLYVGNHCSGTISVIDLDAGRRIYKQFVGKRIRGIFVAPVSGRVFVGSSLGVFELHPEHMDRSR